MEEELEFRGRKEEWGRCTGAGTPLQPVVRGQAVPLQPMEATGGADARLQHMEDSTPEQVAGPKEGRDSVGRRPDRCSSVLGGL